MKLTLKIGVKDLFVTSLIVIFIAHVGYIIHELIYPEFPEIVNYKKNLNEIEFPIVFKICANEANTTIDAEKFHEVGYRDLYKFYQGQSLYNF